MTDAIFNERFGPPPWDLVNENLKALGLPFVVSSPDLLSYDPFKLSVVKSASDEEIFVENLSSGERVLFQFAISMFRYDEDITTVVRPKLLLLDEMDAPLHPEMVKRWLGALGEGLLEPHGISCVLTTHSPTTVALAPENALYELVNGHSGLRKISKQDALNRLTYGVPTLSIDPSGRRQVFAESDTDAAIFERLYSITKSQLSCDRELNFLSTGMKNKDGGEINSGCAVVTKIVEQLAGSGVRNVFGIVDWDGRAKSTGRVKVLAEGMRDGIENVLLDPLLVCLMLIKLGKPPQGLKPIPSGSSTSQVEMERLSNPSIGAPIR